LARDGAVKQEIFPNGAGQTFGDLPDEANRLGYQSASIHVNNVSALRRNAQRSLRFLAPTRAATASCKILRPAPIQRRRSLVEK
jgi:hypothetical protein